MPILPRCVARTRFLGTTTLRKLRAPLASCCVLRKTLSSGPKDEKLSSQFPESADDLDNYDLAYTFPYIRVAAVVNRLKLYQTCVSSVAIPLSFACQSAGLIPSDAALPIAAISVTAVAALFATGALCTDLVGRVWVSRGSAATRVRLSTVGFWGGRSELRLRASELLPLAELDSSLFAPFVSLRRYSAPEAAAPKLCLRFGRVVDAAAFRKALGHAPF